MVRVNRHQLPKNELDALLQQFDTTLSKLDRKTTSIFLSEIFGREERLTFAKRLAAIVLIHEGFSEYKTARLLKLSPSTTGTIALRIEQEKYKGTIAALRKNKKNYGAILDTIDTVLHLGGILPHRTGMDRYRGL